MFYEAVGALHMHTHHSDGTGAPEELIRAAQETGLDWIWITDHDNTDAAPHAGQHKGVTVLVGYEITPFRNHYLVGDIEGVVSRDMPSADFVAEVRAKGGVGIVAHPDERAINEYSECYRWEDWSVRGFDGIELWNYMSDWIQQYTPTGKYLNFFFPEMALRGPTLDTIRWWDSLQTEGHRPTGVFGVDVHAFKVKKFGYMFEVYSYVHCFRTLVNYLQLDAPLSNTFEEAQRQIWDAIRRGRVIMAHRGRGDASGTTFLAATADGKTVSTCGDTVPLTEGLSLEFLCPQDAELRLFQNGNMVVREDKARKLRFACTEPGHYRVEAHRRGMWIMTNHIHVERV